MLLSGHHRRIAEWRLAESRARARPAARRPRRRTCIAPATTRYHKPPHGVGDAATRHAPASGLRAQFATM